MADRIEGTSGAGETERKQQSCDERRDAKQGCFHHCETLQLQSPVCHSPHYILFSALLLKFPYGYANGNPYERACGVYPYS